MLFDGYQRRIRYLRVSLTDKCNLRCVYCMPQEGVEWLSHDEILRNEEFVHLINLFIEMGVEKVRFTGGEPLVRKGFLHIIQMIRAQHPHLEICVSTNGVLLADYLESLRDLRVEKLNISLDTLDRRRYERITGSDALANVRLSIEKAVAMGTFNIKLNAVIFEETLSELNELVAFAAENNVAIRFIERMPFLAEDKTQRFVSSEELLKELHRVGYLERDCRSDTNVAKMFLLTRPDGKKLRVGIIPSVTHKFCGRCDRLRLTCDGHLKTCLYATSEYDLKSLYRQDVGDAVLKKIIFNAVNEKPFEHKITCEQYSSRGCASILSIRTMSKIGG
ncbi:MAG: GTP 3',8-cyclase MoaA [Spirochaetes bacterium]|nr:GTP 3',8-cyclase MoaA [Spirochaetota bacterium]